MNAKRGLYRSLRTPRIDVHTHMLERTASEAGVLHNVITGFGRHALPPPAPGSAQETAERAGYEVERHIEMLDRLHVDAEVLSSLTVMQGTAWAEPELALDLNRRVTDAIASWVAAVWERIAERGLVAFVHPDGIRDPWFQSYSMWNSVGQPIEESKFIASLIYEGVLEQLPELRIVMAHGGGYLPHYYGRLDRNVKAHPHSAVNISRNPSEYLRSLYYDTCVYEPTMLEALVARVGAERIVMGSDFPVGDPDPVGFVERCSALGGPTVGAVLGGTLGDLLG